jgi:hypothetical protein
MIAARRDELLRSQRARREVAWQVVARVLAPIEIAIDAPSAAPPGAPRPTVPRFRTWYDRDDLRRVFQHAYQQLDPADRAARARIGAAALDDAFETDVDAVLSLETWPDWRRDEHLASLDGPTRIDALGGIRRIALSPGAARHVALSYPEVVRCLEEGPTAIAAPATSVQTLAREPLWLAPCDARALGPFVSAGGSLRARLRTSDGRPARATVVISSEGSTLRRCDASVEPECATSEAGALSITVSTDGHPLAATLEIELASDAGPPPACLAGPFPLDAATVAAEWRRVEPGSTLPTYDTSAAALAHRLEGAEATWGEGDGRAAPGPDRIYTIDLESGARFALAGLHIRARELDQWINVTLWYSPAPDDDFGADRPDSIRALGGAWSSYKMCVAIAHDELDPDPGGGFAARAPMLAAALAAVHEGAGGPSWCSSPYIDAGPGLVRSNCVGCHQHAMTGVRPAETLDDEARFPGGGRMQVRDDFPADQFWGLDAGDDLASMMAEVIAWWDAAPVE